MKSTDFEQYPEPPIQDGNGSNGGGYRVTNTSATSPPTPPDLSDNPDLWNYLLVIIMIFLYLAGMMSTGVSVHILLYIFSGGAGITIPIFGSHIPIAEAVTLICTGILEGGSLGDAIHNRRQALSSKKKQFELGRFSSFIGQAIIYYAAGTVFLSQADVSQLSERSLKDSQRATPAMVLEPPISIGNIGVGILSIVFSRAINYGIIDALLNSISAIRRRNKQTEEGDLEALLQWIFSELPQNLMEMDYEREMQALQAQLQLLLSSIENKQVHNRAEDIQAAIGSILTKVPDAVLQKKGWTRQQVQGILTKALPSQHQTSTSQPKGSSSTPTTPKNWFNS